MYFKKKNHKNRLLKFSGLVKYDILEIFNGKNGELLVSQ